MDDVDVLTREKVVVVLVSVNGERLGERIELHTVRPRRGDQLGPRIFGERSPEAVSGIPVTETENCDAVFATHECSKVSFQLPASSSQLLALAQCDARFGSVRLEAGSWQLEA